jgi:hypothetical protein
MVCHVSVGQKLREEIAFLETGHFRPRAVFRRLADPKRPVPQNYVYGVGLVLQIFIKILSFHHKLFRFLIWTDRQTDRHYNYP